MKLEFDPNGFEDLRYWVKTDQRKASRILKLIGEVLKTPYSGTGKPEPLRFTLSGCWSRRIDQANRLVYKVEKETVIILSCRYHY